MTAQESDGEQAARPAAAVRHQIWWLAVLGLAGLVVYFARWVDVFPAASIELKLPRAFIQRTAQGLADELGYPSAGAITSTIFSFDEDAKTFLEYELGLSAANELMKEEVPVWYWSTHLCRPLKLEEFSTDISPQGKLVGFGHTLENDRALPSVSHDQARQMARQFVAAKAGVSLDTWKQVEDGEVAQPHRTDHYFTWEDPRREFKGSHLRIYVSVSGNIVSGFKHFLYIPETWLRKYSGLRSYNKALEEVASIFYVAFNTAIFFAFIWVFASGLVRWRFALVAALVVAGGDFVDALNSFPSSIHSYSPEISYSGYIVEIYFSALRGALGQFLQAFMLAGAAEGIYRLAYPDKVALEKVFGGSGLRSSQVVNGLGAGHAIFGIHLGWVVLYYLLGRDVGIWSPLEIRNVEGLSAVFPFFSSMYVGLSASFFEELTYRVLGMGIFQRLTRSFWLANLLQAAAWAFMHSNYPQEPPWARGVELTAVGFLYGWVLRRYGLIACLVSHYVFDAFLGVSPLLAADLVGLKASAIVTVAPFALFLAVALVLRLRFGLADEQTLLNRRLPVQAKAAELAEIFPEVTYEYRPLSKRLRQALVGLSLAAALLQFGYFFPVVADREKVTISRQQAIDLASQYLIERNTPLAGRINLAWLAPGIDAEALQYIFEKAGFAETSTLAMMPGHPLVWHVRFFRPLDVEEYLVTLDASGHPLALNSVLAEDAPGARLAQDKARARVEDYLRREHPEIQPFTFDDAAEERRKNRSDWTFHFRVPQYKVAEADFKLKVCALGDLVCNFDQSWDVPDKWRWERQRVTTKDQLATYAVVALRLAALGALIWWTVGVARSGAIRWRPAVLLALAMSVLVIPQALNDLPEFYRGYGTDTPLVAYFVAQSVNQVMVALSMIGTAAFLGAFGYASFRLLFPKLSIGSILKATFGQGQEPNRANQLNLWIDAVLVGYAVGIGHRALLVLWSAAHAYFSPVVTITALDRFCNLVNVFNPALDGIMDGVSRGMALLLGAGVLAGLYAKYFRSARGFALFAVVISLIYPCTTRYWQDYIMDVAIYILYFALIWLAIARLARQNLLAYFLAGAVNAIAEVIRTLSYHGSVLYTNEIATLALVLLSPLVYLAVLLGRGVQGATAAQRERTLNSG